MKIDILTIFPDMFMPVLGESVLKRAQMKKLVNVRVRNLRDWTKDKHKTVDERPFGGGPGMVLKPEPIFLAVEELKQRIQNTEYRIQNGNLKLKTKNLKSETRVILLTPQGQTFNQTIARELTKFDHLILICGRYEGVDQRVIDHLADDQLSIGEYVLSGGELPAMVVVDAVVRLIPGVLGNSESLRSESFNEAGQFDYPQYTQPRNFRGWLVPEVLLTGNHQEISKWRKEQMINDNKKD